ncbi:hypothetical protein DYU11_20385 [Fibrisoma montanum]|uniref:Leucine-rich repeat domain-containing protein n=1 Tax=Fibrisoma montanum TaxID=2305895 RepID=A0A418M3X2_9BACT|nr:hypothetical protein [Fibrisoma montanum]RIV20409.1 hypothetical protein DYU11_20385 [Fibrisoma montanum]
MYYYYLDTLLDGTIFPNIQAFKLQPFYGDIHIPALSGSFENDEGVCRRILDAMPNLKHLVVPNSPNKAFFELESHPLLRLDVQSFWYDNQHFIENLTHSRCFKALKYLRFTESLHDSRVSGDKVSYERYLEFFTKANLPNLKEVELRNTTLNVKQIKALRSTPLGARLNKLQCSQEYPTERVFLQRDIITGEVLQTMWQDNNDWRNQKYPIT